MSEVQLNDAFFQKSAGWEAVQHARALLGAGKVLSSNWTPPVLKGVVQAGDITYRAGLVIHGIADIENLCTCRPSREDGQICAHSVAVGLHHLKPAAAANASTARGPSTGPSPRIPPPKAPLALSRSAGGEALEIRVILPPNFMESFARGKVTLVFEGLGASGSGPLSSFVRRGPFQLCESDERLLTSAEELTGGDTPGMCQLPARDFLKLLSAMTGHPRITIGRDQSFQISAVPYPLKLTANLDAQGELTLALAGNRPQNLLLSEDTAWVKSGSQLQPLGLPASFRSLLDQPLRLTRPQIPAFLAQHWPVLNQAGSIQANFQLGDFELKPAPPKFLLQLVGGMAQLTATLQCAYGSRIMTVGVTAATESAWMPDPSHPRRYSARDLGAEHEAFQRLRRAGFLGPNAQGLWQMHGQDRVIAFFARDYPRWEREWEIRLEERLERSTRNHLERVTPQFRVTSSGEQWFDLEVQYTSSGGDRFSAADIQQMLRGGGTRKLANGKWAILDAAAIEEVQEVLLDCAPEQRSGNAAMQCRLAPEQAGFLEASLRAQGFTIQAPAAWRDRSRALQGELKFECPPLGPLTPILRPYQKHGVAWLGFLRAHGFGGILADEMGLGKTLQVLAHLSTLRRAAPTLVVCPTSLVFNWAAEAAKWVPNLPTLTLEGPQRHSRFRQIPNHALVITSYALARRDAARYREFEFDTVVLDEAQHIKNRETQNAQAVKSIRSAHRLVLTGTPLENSVLDLWSIFDFLMPGYLGTSADFRERYEVPISRERDPASMTRLAKRVRPFLLRRLKRDVAPELPAKLEQISFCELSEEQAVVYQQLLAHTRKEVLEATGEAGLAKSRMLVLTALLRLRQVCCDLRLLDAKGENTQQPRGPEGPSAAAPDASPPSGKLQLFGELLDEVVDGGHRVLVFSQFTSMLRLLQEELANRNLTHCYLDGTTRDRAAVVERFQRDSSIPVFLISLKAGGVGLNLTGADTVIHFDPWWNPAVEDQATDRAHRIGQTKVVTNYKLITRGTVEEKILNLQRKKREVIAATLTGEDVFTESLTWQEIEELLS